MNNTEKKCIKILNYRTDKGIAPKPENIVHGEIAIGYKKDNEAIYIKNSTNEIVDFTPTSIVSLTYAELKNLRDNSKLKPSQYYRITDFVTTVANDPEAQSAGHQFDIIVMASDKDKLQEECYAIQNEGDTYFANCNLAAWKIWYCLDNDNTKYAWADTVNGKGVIYRMIDEWGNDCPYDFKNVQFKRYWANGIILQGYYGTLSNAGDVKVGVDTNDHLYLFTFTRLNNILEGYEKGSVEQSNVLDESIQTEGFYFSESELQNRCHSNILKPTETVLVVDTNEYITFILLNNVFITTQNDNDYLTYLPPFDNTFGSNCSNNTFGNYCYYNRFGNSCYSNSFGIGYYGNTFGNDCYGNTFGDYCDSNTFGNSYSNNTFGNSCYSNSFGNSCSINSFGNGCYGNTFGNSCYGNTFGNYCDDNRFGNNLRYNTLGNNFRYNTFGNYCNGNTFGNNFRYNTLGNSIQYVEIATEKIFHTHILNGTQGTNSSNRLTIEFTPETAYSQFAGFTSDNVLKTWVEADDPHEVVDGGYY